MSIESLICHPGVAGDLDVADTLEELDTVVDEVVDLGCFEEIEAAHKVASDMFHAQLAQSYSAVSTEHAERMSKAGEEFNRMGCEDLRGVLASLVNRFVDTDSTSELRLLARYFLFRKLGGQVRRSGQINLAENHEVGAAQQLRRLTDAVGRIEDR